MAVAYENFSALNHQLRFLLFEHGKGISEGMMDDCIEWSHRKILKDLKRIAYQQGMCPAPLVSPHIDDVLTQIQIHLKKNQDPRIFSHKKLGNQLHTAISHLALAYAYKQHRLASLISAIKPHQNMLGYLLQLNPQESFYKLHQLTYQPNLISIPLSKELNLSLRELLQYAPQFEPSFSMHWAAIHHSLIQDDVLQYTQRLFKQYPKTIAEWQQRLTIRQLDWQQYTPLPVHPLYWRHHLSEIASSWVHNDRFVLMANMSKATAVGQINTVCLEENKNAGMIVPIFKEQDNQSNTSDFNFHDGQIVFWKQEIKPKVLSIPISSTAFICPITQDTLGTLTTKHLNWPTVVEQSYSNDYF